mgnify:CR=1 FL=1
MVLAKMNFEMESTDLLPFPSQEVREREREIESEREREREW